MKDKKHRKLAVVIMAAGKGTRMKNPDMAKVMYEINGKPMIHYVVDISEKLDPEIIITIVGWQRDTVVNYFKSVAGKIEFIDQTEQLGTGHAIMQTTERLKKFEGNVLVLSGDVPSLKYETVDNLISFHENTNAFATILTTNMNDPSGYGRIIRDDNSNVIKIVEQKDANPEQLKVKEINSGIYIFDKEKLFDALETLKPNNAQGEYYLTDVFEYFWNNNYKVSAVIANDSFEVMGINSLDQLDEARKIFRQM